ncbi:hypothetical protein P3S68_001861 [Capsicum galapagoense]
MGRGVSYGGGKSSLGYLFRSGEVLKSTTTNAPAVQSEGPAINKELASKPAVSAVVDATKQIPAGIQSTASRNHFSYAASGPISPMDARRPRDDEILTIVVDFVANCLRYSIMMM